MDSSNKQLYEKIMRNVSKLVKRTLNEEFFDDPYRGPFEPFNIPWNSGNSKPSYILYNLDNTRMAVYNNYESAMMVGLAYINEEGERGYPYFLIDEKNDIIYFQPSSGIDLDKELGEKGYKASDLRVTPGFDLHRKYYCKLEDPDKKFRRKLEKHMGEYRTLILREIPMFH